MFVGVGVFVGVRVGVAVGPPGVFVGPGGGVFVGWGTGVFVGANTGVFVATPVGVGVGAGFVDVINTLSNVAVPSSELLWLVTANPTYTVLPIGITACPTRVQVFPSEAS